MELHWKAALLILCVEVALALTLVPAWIPPGLKKMIIGWSTNPTVHKTGKIYLIVASVLCAGLW
jgi:hypothetical protein